MEKHPAQPSGSSVQHSVKQDRPRSASLDKKVSRQQNPRISVQQNQPISSGRGEQPRSSRHHLSLQEASAILNEVHQVHSNRLGNFRQYLFVMNMAISYMIVGSSIGWAAPLLYEAKKHGIEGTKFTVAQSVIIGALLFLAMMVTPLPAGILCDYIGRKWALIIAGSISCASWLLVVFMSDIGMLYSSRVLAGLYAGSVLTIGPIYIAEAALPEIRGSLEAFNAIMLLFGAELTFVLGPNVAVRHMAITCGVMPHLFLVMMFCLPESPYWLIYKKKYVSAQRNFEWLRGTTLASSQKLRVEYQNIIADVEKDVFRLANFRGLCSTTSNKRGLVIVQVLTALQRLSESTAVTVFSTVTIPDANIGSLRPKNVISVLGFCWILSTMIAFLLIDKVGRVPLLVASCIGCFIANVSSASWFYNNIDNLNSPSTLSAHWFPFASITFFGVFYIIGLGTVPAVLQGEMFSPAYRALASAITVIVASGMSGFVNSTYTPISTAYGVHVNFTFYAIICLITLTFTLLFVPETKGKPLHTIQKELAEDW